MWEFVTSHVDDMLAVLFAAYALARAIVALTPTPKDNAAVEEIGKFVSLLAKFFGLDVTQGRGKPPSHTRPKA